MLFEIAAVQIIVIAFFSSLERCFPARRFKKSPRFYLWLGTICVFGVCWLKVVLLAWLAIPFEGLVPIGHLEPVSQGAMFYFAYSFGNYWFHRLKHSNTVLWRYLHLFHHAPRQMETVVAFFRHPLEMVANTVYLLIIGKLLFGANAEAIAIALAIEGCLEVFHHSNLRTPSQFRWIGYIFQIPEMHLLHHEYGLHKYNYGPFIWDAVFGTAKIPNQWDKELGFSFSNNLTRLLLLRLPKRT